MITPIDIADLHATIKTYGTIAVIGLAVAGIVLYLAFSRVRDGWLWVSGILSAMEAHMVNVQRLTGEDHWKSCQLDKCPYLQKHFEQLRDVDEHIQNYAKDCEKSHDSVLAAIDTILRRQDSLFSNQDNLFTAILGALRKNGYHE